MKELTLPAVTASSTRCVAVLFLRPPPHHALEALLRPLGAVRAEGGTLALAVGEVTVRIDVHARPWPLQADAYQQALDHPWTCRASRMAAPNHQAFVALAIAGSKQPIADLMLLTRAAEAIAAAPGALGLFTPAGQALRSLDLLRAGLRALGTAPAPVDLWVNTRLGSLGPRWQVMDTIGMAQLGHLDLAALFATDRTNYRGADAFLKNLCLYVAGGGLLGDGDRLPGPDGTDWEVRAADSALMPPERPMLQLAAVGGPDLGVVVKG